MDVIDMLRQGFHQQNQQQRQQQSPQQQMFSSNNPILQYFHLERHVCNAGQELIWKVYDAVRIVDDKKASVLIFEKKIADKLHKPRRKEAVTELVKRDLELLSQMNHSKIIKTLHPMVESIGFISFATEPLLCSLHNLLGNVEKLPVSVQQQVKELSLLDEELKCGLYQVAQATGYLHNVKKILHSNLCPQNILITKKGVWKIMGFAFSSPSTGDGVTEYFHTQPWQSKLSKMTQPDLDFIAPEIQSDSRSKVTCSSDVFSLGMVACWIFNGGKPLIQTSYNASLYWKQMSKLEELFTELLGKVPVTLHETLHKMIHKEPKARPSIQYISMCKYFDDPAVECLKMLDVLTEAKEGWMPGQDIIDNISHNIVLVPEKILQATLLPTISEQLVQQDRMPIMLPLLLALAAASTEKNDCFKTFFQVEIKKILTSSLPIQVSVYLLDKLDILVRKCKNDEVKNDILPFVLNSYNSNNIQIQESALGSFSVIKNHLDLAIISNLILPKAKALFNKATNVRTKLTCLNCIERLLDSLEKMVILDEVIPFLMPVQCTDTDIVMSVVAIYRKLISDRKFGLTHNLLANKIMPSLLPLSVYPGLNLEQFTMLMELLHTMLSQIEQERLNKMIQQMPTSQQLKQHRRTSMETKKLLINSNTNMFNQSLLNVEYNAYRPPSNPEFLTQNSSMKDSQDVHGYKRHASFQSLGMAEQAVFEMVRQRRLSQLSGRTDSGSHLGYGFMQQQQRMQYQQPLPNPHIHISQASMTSSLKENVSNFFTGKRNSTVSIGPIVLPEFVRRESAGRLFSNVPIRRSSFQGICESAMQYFGVK